MKYDIVIIGSGVAGLTAGLYSARAKKSVLIIENGVLGGTTASLELIENYPGCINISGFDLIQNMFSQVQSLGVNIEFMNIKSIDFDNNMLYTDANTIEYEALIIASGTSYKMLNLANEDNFKFKGLSYCAVCDGSLFKNKKVAVVTDGYSGKADIDYLSNITSDIVVFDISDKYKSDKLTVYNNSEILSLNGNNYLDSIDYKYNNEIINIKIDGMFVLLGKYTNIKLYEDHLDSENGFLVTDENMHTNFDNVFVAGDVRKKSLRQIITACSDGAIAATEAIKYLVKK